MNPTETVAAYVELTAACLDALRREFTGIERPTIEAGMSLRPRNGGPNVRSGTLPGLGEFRIHGIGCRFELESGAIVDVDWDTNGQAVFDAWRILVFAQSTGDETVDKESLRLAATRNPDLVVVTPDTFAWRDGRYNMKRGSV